MKRMLLLSIALLMVIGFGCSKSEDFTEAGELKAKISRVSGNVQLIRDNKIEPAKMNMIISGKDTIKALNGSADLHIARRGIFKVKPNSVVEITSLAKETRINVKGGKLLLALQKLKRDKDLEIETPTAVAGVRGTSFLVSVSGQNTKVGVLTGEVGVRTFDGFVKVNELKEVKVAGKELKNVSRMNITTIVDVKGILKIKDIENMKEYRKIKANIKKLEIIEQSDKETDVDVEALRNAIKAKGMEEGGSALGDEIRKKSSEIKSSGDLESRKKKFIEDDEL